MAWYKFLKYSQIWDISYNKESLQKLLPALYELTYKYQTLQKQQFQGYPKRKDNILSGLENKARQVISDIIEILQPTFEDWLEKHALFNPNSWATQRVDECYEINGSNIKGMANQLKYMASGGPNNYTATIPDIIRNLNKAIENKQAPMLSNIFKNIKRDLIEEDKDNQDPEYKRTEEQIEEYYNNMDFWDYFETFYQEDLGQFLEDSSQFYDIYELSVEIAQYACFPIWYGMWQPEGIDETRQNVENAYLMIKSVQQQPIHKALATINEIINTCHQTGDMLEYICERTNDYPAEVFRTMSYLSSMNDSSPEIQKWNQDLREIGSQIQSELPSSPAQDVQPTKIP